MKSLANVDRRPRRPFLLRLSGWEHCLTPRPAERSFFPPFLLHGPSPTPFPLVSSHALPPFLVDLGRPLSPPPATFGGLSWPPWALPPRDVSGRSNGRGTGTFRTSSGYAISRGHTVVKTRPSSAVAPRAC